MPRSIVAWFVVCWSAFLLASIVVGLLLFSLYRQSTSEQLRRGAAAVTHGCDAIAARYQFFISSMPSAPADLHASEVTQGLTAAVRIALRNFTGVEGGIWQTQHGSLAYAFPTYEGSSEKTDLPPAEEPQIRAAAEAAALDGMPVDRRRDGRLQVLLLHACPLAGPIPQLAAWAMTRVDTAGSRAYGQAMGGLAVLFVVVLGSAVWLGRLLLGWSQRLRQLESALASRSDELPRLEPTGQRDLDRIVAAINRAGSRLADAHRTAEMLMRRAAEDKRLASLGRVVAGVAHEIRNPIAAMRLKAENAMAAGADPARKDRALGVVVEQIARLEDLLRNLLNSVHPAVPEPKPIPDVSAFLKQRADLFREQADALGIALVVDDSAAKGAFDPVRIGQALDNLILNAIQNTPPGGRIVLRADQGGDQLLLSVADTGRGVPHALREQLFEPFVTGRPEGTGLGLAVVCEVAQAHGGSVRAIHRDDGTTFVLELPWQPS